MTTALANSGNMIDNTIKSNLQSVTIEQLHKQITALEKENQRLETENRRLETWLDLVSKGYSIAISQLSVNSRMP